MPFHQQYNDIIILYNMENLVPVYTLLEAENMNKWHIKASSFPPHERKEGWFISSAPGWMVGLDKLIAYIFGFL